MPSVVLGTSFAGPNNELFKVADYIGHGSFGEVYRAVGELTGTVVAIKLLPLGDLSSDEQRNALLNEVRTSQSIKHPNVVEVLHVNDGSSSEVGPCVVMEFISGNLEKFLSNQKEAKAQIPLPRAIEMMIALAQGANAINQKIVHRDIKPDNILIQDERLKIGDFGIAKFVDESTRLISFKGIQHCAYKSPESWQNQPNTIKMDVYSVGLVCYQILTLKHPLDSHIKDPSDFAEWRKAHLFEVCPDPRTLRPEVPLSIAQLLLRMVSKHPNERPYWDETLKILTQPTVAAVSQHPAVKAAVEAAHARAQDRKKQALETLKKQDKRETQLDFYRFSCAEVLAQLEPVVAQFNESFQGGQITRRTDGGVTIFDIPEGASIQVHFFRPPDNGIKTNIGEVIGGGWIGIYNGRSANLTLLRQTPDDEYGVWKICEMKVGGIYNPAAIMRQIGLKANTAEPFGLAADGFYEHIQFIRGPGHVLNYILHNSLGDFFAELLAAACKQ